MQSQFKALSLSYKNAPVEVREMMALNEADIKLFLQRIKEMLSLSDVLVVSTCNRTEIYYSAEKNHGHELIGILSMVKQLSQGCRLLEHFIQLNEANEAAQHLFRVSLGLESQVVGDMQISNQIKRSYQWSADADMAGPLLHRLMHTVFFASKRVAQETSFRDGAASVSYAASELVSTISEQIANPKVLVVGLGEIGADLCKHLADAEQDVVLCNRTQQKADALATELGFPITPFEGLHEELTQYDIVISSIAKNDPFFTKTGLEGRLKEGYTFFVDLSVPRSVAHDVAELSGVSVYNVDDIASKSDAALAKRKAAIPQVEEIISEAMSGLREWSQEMEVSPTIKKLKNTLEQIRQEEIARHLKNASDEEIAFAEKFSKSMTQKIMKLPVLQLKAACKRGEAETLIDVLNDLFDLEKQPAKK